MLCCVYDLIDVVQDLWLAYAIVILMCFIYIKNSAVNFFITREKSSHKCVLFVIAHPDDECMFFTPTILSLLEEGHNVYILCLSKGDYEGLGDVRKKELVNSCSKLGIPASNVTVIDDDRLKDGLDSVWDSDVIGNFILSGYLRVGAQSVITFDNGGVSGHPNHMAIFKALQNLYQSGKLANTTVFTLETTNIVRKYTSILDVPISSIFTLPTFLSSPKQIMKAWHAMAEHKSQLVWFRKLYIIFSRYMFVNTLQQMS